MGNRSLDDFRDADATSADEDETDAESEPAGEAAAGEAAAGETTTGETTTGETTTGESGSERVEGPETDEPADAAGPDDPVAVDSSGAEVDADARVDPAVSTYVWSASGGACAACGRSTPARWRQDDRLVCRDCKEW